VNVKTHGNCSVHDRDNSVTNVINTVVYLGSMDITLHVYSYLRTQNNATDE